MSRRDGCHSCFESYRLRLSQQHHHSRSPYFLSHLASIYTMGLASSKQPETAFHLTQLLRRFNPKLRVKSFQLPPPSPSSAAATEGHPTPTSGSRRVRSATLHLEVLPPIDAAVDAMSPVDILVLLSQLGATENMHNIEKTMQWKEALLQALHTLVQTPIPAEHAEVWKQIKPKMDAIVKERIPRTGIDFTVLNVHYDAQQKAATHETAPDGESMFTTPNIWELFSPTETLRPQIEGGNRQMAADDQRQKIEALLTEGFTVDDTLTLIIDVIVLPKARPWEGEVGDVERSVYQSKIDFQKISYVLIASGDGTGRPAFQWSSAHRRDTHSAEAEQRDESDKGSVPAAAVSSVASHHVDPNVVPQNHPGVVGDGAISVTLSMNNVRLSVACPGLDDMLIARLGSDKFVAGTKDADDVSIRLDYRRSGGAGGDQLYRPTFAPVAFSNKALLAIVQPLSWLLAGTAAEHDEPPQAFAPLRTWGNDKRAILESDALPGLPLRQALAFIADLATIFPDVQHSALQICTAPPPGAVSAASCSPSASLMPQSFPATCTAVEAFSSSFNEPFSVKQAAVLTDAAVSFHAIFRRLFDDVSSVEACTDTTAATHQEAKGSFQPLKRLCSSLAPGADAISAAILPSGPFFTGAPPVDLLHGSALSALTAAKSKLERGDKGRTAASAAKNASSAGGGSRPAPPPPAAPSDGSVADDGSSGAPAEAGDAPPDCSTIPDDEAFTKGTLPSNAHFCCLRDIATTRIGDGKKVITARRLVIGRQAIPPPVVADASTGPIVVRSGAERLLFQLEGDVRLHLDTHAMGSETQPQATSPVATEGTEPSAAPPGQTAMSPRGEAGCWRFIGTHANAIRHLNECASLIALHCQTPRLEYFFSKMTGANFFMAQDFLAMISRQRLRGVNSPLQCPMAPLAPVAISGGVAAPRSAATRIEFTEGHVFCEQTNRLMLLSGEGSCCVIGEVEGHGRWMDAPSTTTTGVTFHTQEATFLTPLSHWKSKGNVALGIVGMPFNQRPPHNGHRAAEEVEGGTLAEWGDSRRFCQVSLACDESFSATVCNSLGNLDSVAALLTTDALALVFGTSVTPSGVQCASSVAASADNMRDEEGAVIQPGHVDYRQNVLVSTACTVQLKGDVYGRSYSLRDECMPSVKPKRVSASEAAGDNTTGTGMVIVHDVLSTVAAFSVFHGKNVYFDRRPRGSTQTVGGGGGMTTAQKQPPLCRFSSDHWRSRTVTVEDCHALSRNYVQVAHLDGGNGDAREDDDDLPPAVLAYLAPGLLVTSAAMRWLWSRFAGLYDKDMAAAIASHRNTFSASFSPRQEVSSPQVDPLNVRELADQCTTLWQRTVAEVNATAPRRVRGPTAGEISKFARIFIGWMEHNLWTATIPRGFEFECNRPTEYDLRLCCGREEAPTAVPPTTLPTHNHRAAAAIVCSTPIETTSRFFPRMHRAACALDEPPHASIRGTDALTELLGHTISALVGLSTFNASEYAAEHVTRIFVADPQQNAPTGAMQATSPAVEMGHTFWQRGSATSAQGDVSGHLVPVRRYRTELYVAAGGGDAAMMDCAFFATIRGAAVERKVANVSVCDRRQSRRVYVEIVRPVTFVCTTASSVHPWDHLLPSPAGSDPKRRREATLRFEIKPRGSDKSVDDVASVYGDRRGGAEGDPSVGALATLAFTYHDVNEVIRSCAVQERMAVGGHAPQPCLPSDPDSLLIASEGLPSCSDLDVCLIANGCTLRGDQLEQCHVSDVMRMWRTLVLALYRSGSVWLPVQHGTTSRRGFPSCIPPVRVIQSVLPSGQKPAIKPSSQAAAATPTVPPTPTNGGGFLSGWFGAKSQASATTQSEQASTTAADSDPKRQDESRPLAVRRPRCVRVSVKEDVAVTFNVRFNATPPTPLVQAFVEFQELIHLDGAADITTRSSAIPAELLASGGSAAAWLRSAQLVAACRLRTTATGVEIRDPSVALRAASIDSAGPPLFKLDGAFMLRRTEEAEPTCPVSADVGESGEAMTDDAEDTEGDMTNEERHAAPPVGKIVLRALTHLDVSAAQAGPTPRAPTASIHLSIEAQLLMAYLLGPLWYDTGVADFFSNAFEGLAESLFLAAATAAAAAGGGGMGAPSSLPLSMAIDQSPIADALLTFLVGTRDYAFSNVRDYGLAARSHDSKSTALLGIEGVRTLSRRIRDIIDFPVALLRFVDRSRSVAKTSPSIPTVDISGFRQLEQLDGGDREMTEVYQSTRPPVSTLAICRLRVIHKVSAFLVARENSSRNSVQTSTSAAALPPFVDLMPDTLSHYFSLSSTASLMPLPVAAKSPASGAAESQEAALRLTVNSLKDYAFNTAATVPAAVAVLVKAHQDLLHGINTST